MPEMDGVETFHAIREQKLATHTPIIMLTANAIIGSKEHYLQEGFHDFLSKPIMPEKLDQMILKHLPNKYIVTDNTGSLSGDAPAATSIGFPLERICKMLPEIDSVTGLATCSGDTDFYLELLQDFVVLPIKVELMEYLEKKDAQNYCIRVHGFKNNAYSIGAKALGDLAYQLEKLSRDSQWTNIPTLQTQLFEQYDRICAAVNQIID